MSMIQFVANHDDLSTDRGYQFRFHCDKCGNGHMSEFQASVTGTVGGVLRAAGSVFGGVLGRAGAGAYEVQRAVGGKEHDAALRKAVEDGKRLFKQCSRCGKWVCSEVCWNAARQLCEGCAPDAQEELAAAQAEAFREQVHAKARAVDQTAGVDVEVPAVAGCPSCGAKITGGKFCGECGAALRAVVTCAGCGAEAKAGTKFCPECGRSMVSS